MNLSKAKLKRIIREAVTSQIKKMTPYDRAMRSIHHGYQFPEDPEESIKDLGYREKISAIRNSGEEGVEQADFLAPQVGGSEKPHFAPNPNMSFEELRDKSKEQKAAAYFEYVEDESAYLEIEYRLRWIEEYELVEMAEKYQPGFKRGIGSRIPNKVLQQQDLITNSRLVEMMDELYTSKNVLTFHTNINNYIVDPAYAQERAKLTKAFNDTPTDSLNNPSKPWKPKSWFTFTSKGSENTLEEFLKEKAERLLRTAISTAY